MRLTKHELEFIKLAIILSDGVYDYQLTSREFKNDYNITPKQAQRMLEALDIKVRNELRKRMSKSGKIIG